MEEFVRVPLPQTNCYLLPGKNGWLLVDCGSPGDEAALLSALRRANVPLSAVRWLFLTHHHRDHCGLLSWILAQNPAVRIIASAKCMAYVETGRNHHPAGEQYASAGLRLAFGLYGRCGGQLDGTYSACRARAGDVLLQDAFGALPDAVGIAGRVLLTPGHTEDSATLIVGENAFAGDAARNLLNGLGAPRQPVLLYDRAACFASWERIVSTGVRRVCPGHGRCFRAELLRRVPGM